MEPYLMCGRIQTGVGGGCYGKAFRRHCLYQIENTFIAVSTPAGNLLSCDYIAWDKIVNLLYTGSIINPHKRHLWESLDSG